MRDGQPTQRSNDKDHKAVARMPRFSSKLPFGKAIALPTAFEIYLSRTTSLGSDQNIKIHYEPVKRQVFRCASLVR